MKIQRLLGSTIVLALLLAPGETSGVSALPGQVAVVAAENVIYAASCSQADVQAAINVAGDGDFVLVPAGHCAWTTPAGNNDVPAVLISGKAITLQGMGTGQTVITDTTGTGWNNYLLRVNGVDGKPFRITGFTFAALNTPAAIGIYGTSKEFRRPLCIREPDQFRHGDHCDRLYLRRGRSLHVSQLASTRERRR